MPMKTVLRRRTLDSALVVALIMALGGMPAEAQTKDVKVALIAPLSGPWARQGQLMRMGAYMAIDEINQNGGIKALDGAKLVLLVPHARDRTDKAKNAAQRAPGPDHELV